MREAYIYDCLRSPRGRGKREGSLHEIKPVYLLRNLLLALQQRHSLDTSQIEDVIIGCATPTGEQGANIAKTAVLTAGWSNTVPGIQINRFDASGLDSIALAAAKLRSGWEDLLVAGGVESMSRVQMGSDRGALLYDPAINAQTRHIPQGISADLLATLERMSRTELDDYALRSQQLAKQAQEQGRFQRSLVPVYDDCGLLISDRDEYLRPDTDADKLAALPPAFEAEGKMGFDAVALLQYPFIERVEHLHTAGNSSGVVDGAAIALLGSREAGKRIGLKPRARIVSVGLCADEPTLMLTAALPATHKALKKAGLSVADIDLWEYNEAFAAPVLHFLRNLNIDPQRFNVCGGAIALGHPLGASGTILLCNLLDELECRQLKTGCIAICANAGMGLAVVVERLG